MQDLEGFSVGYSAPSNALAGARWWAAEVTPDVSEGDAPQYRFGLPTVELVAEIRRLLAAERTINGLLCRYLADSRGPRSAA
jgi:hypothetical protein